MTVQTELLRRRALLLRLGGAFAVLVALLVALMFLDDGGAEPVQTPTEPLKPIALPKAVLPPVPAAVEASAAEVLKSSGETGHPAAVPNGSAVAGAPSGNGATGAADTPSAPALQCPPPPAAPPAPVCPPAATRARPSAQPGKGYMVQLGVFGDPVNAEGLQESLSGKGFGAYVQSRVVVGPFANRREAEKAQQQLVRKGYGKGVVVDPRN